MNRADRKRWKSARTLADIGDLTAEWLFGDIEQTPGHCGPPDPETIPHLDVLAAANRAGFVTTNSQSASGPADDGAWDAWAHGFASEETLERLRTAAAGTPLEISGARRRVTFGTGICCSRCLRRAWRHERSFYSDRCPRAADEISAAWLVVITDPEPGRNDRLWPMLASFAESPELPSVARSRTRRHGGDSTRQEA